MAQNDLFAFAFRYPVDPKSSRRHGLELARLAGCPHGRFPGSQPVSCRRQLLARLDPDDYVALEKTDGVRSLVFFPSNDSEARETMPSVLLVNRQNRYYALPGWPATPSGQPFWTGTCRGTILDGELVFRETKPGRKQLSFLIFDCLAVRGQRMTTQPFLNRNMAAENLMQSLEAVHCPTAASGTKHENLTLSLKRAWPCQDLGYLIGSVIPQLGHRNDGLVIAHKRAPYIFGTTDLNIKWKASSDLSVDFRLRDLKHRGRSHKGRTCKGPEGSAQFGLFAANGRSPEKFYAPLILLASETMMPSLCRWRLEGKVVECYRDMAGHWHLHLDTAGLPRVRKDKRSGNQWAVVADIVGAMEDGINEDELLDILCSQQQRQRQRHARPPSMRQAPHL